MRTRLRRSARNAAVLVKSEPDVEQIVARTSADGEQDRDVLVWSPEYRLSATKIRYYLTKAEKNNVSSEKAHEILAFFNYDVKKAISFCEEFVVPDLLSDAEKLVVLYATPFERFRGLSSSRRYFPLRRLLPQQSYGTVNEYHYRNKKNNYEFVPRGVPFKLDEEELRKRFPAPPMDLIEALAQPKRKKTIPVRKGTRRSPRLTTVEEELASAKRKATAAPVARPK